MVVETLRNKPPAAISAQVPEEGFSGRGSREAQAARSSEASALSRICASACDYRPDHCRRGLDAQTFFVQREGCAHATFEENVTYVPLTDKVNLEQVVLRVENTGHRLFRFTQATLRIQQVLPILGCDSNDPCVVHDVNNALAAVPRISDHFAWPLISSREAPRAGAGADKSCRSVSSCPLGGGLS